MCMEDFRIGRKIQYNFYSLSCSTSQSGAKLLANPSRVSLFLQNNGSVAVQGFPELEVLPVAGIWLAAKALPITFDIRMFGTLVTARWNFVTASSTTDLCVIEGILEER